MASFKTNNRLTFAWIVNLGLLVLTVTISIAGYQAYDRLNNMVDELEQNAEPNYNLLILKEISFFVNEMESEIDAYRSSPKPEHIRNFNALLNNSQYLIDSLKENYDQGEMIERCDSLSYLIKEGAKVQTKLIAINSDLLGSTLESLTQKIEALPQTIADADTVEEHKKITELFLGKIFKKAPKKDTFRKADTVRTFTN